MAQIQVNIGRRQRLKPMTVASSARRWSGPKRSRPESDLTLILQDLCLGHTVADVMVILGSVDIVIGVVDR